MKTVIKVVEHNWVRHLTLTPNHLNQKFGPITQKNHGLHKGYASIIDADPLGLVWNKSIAYPNNIVPIGKKGVLVVWNGETYDMEWCYCAVYGPNATV